MKESIAWISTEYQRTTNQMSPKAKIQISTIHLQTNSKKHNNDSHNNYKNWDFDSINYKNSGSK